MTLNDDNHNNFSSSSSSLKKESKIHLLQLKQHQLSDTWDEFCTQRELDLFYKQFQEWSFLLSTQHSILLYGFGSKRFFLQKFIEKELYKHGHVLSLEGYDKDISLDDILNIFVQSFLNGVETLKLLLILQFQHHRYIVTFKKFCYIESTGKSTTTLYPSLRDSAVQDALSILVSSSTTITARHGEEVENHHSHCYHHLIIMFNPKDAYD